MTIIYKIRELTYPSGKAATLSTLKNCVIQATVPKMSKIILPPHLSLQGLTLSNSGESSILMEHCGQSNFLSPVTQLSMKRMTTFKSLSHPRDYISKRLRS